MFKRIKDHPIVATAFAIGAGISAIGGFWAAFSPDPFIPSVGKLVVSVLTARSVVGVVSVIAFLLSIGVLGIVAVTAARSRREVKKLIQTVDELESGRNSLNSELRRVAQEREHFRKKLVETKERFGYERLEMYSGMRFDDGKTSPIVTVRFAHSGSYGGDYDIAKKIEKILNECTRWEVNIDGSNTPTLDPAGEHKVLFDSSWSQSFDRIGAAFRSGELLGEGISVAWSTSDRNDHHHLIIKVLPSRG
jgi:hypothetical protein